MKPLRIDFAPGAAVVFSSGRNLWWVLLIAGLVVFAAAAGLGMRRASEADALNKRANELMSSRQSLEDAARSDSALAPSAYEGINNAVVHLNYPWDTLLGALEQRSRPDVSVISIELGLSKSSLKVVIQAADVDRALAYVDDLRTEPLMRRVAVTKQESVNTDQGPAIKFALEVPSSDRTAVAPAKGAER